MEEKAKKRRDWIKNATIIFLVIMLLLTFFSNTIMNYSLPEVSAQYTNSGNITAKIRGTAVVEAVMPYEIKVEEKRLVEDVKVKMGDTIKKGQVLFLLGAIDEKELVETEEALDAANYEYQQKLLKDLPDYSTNNLEIQFARDDYQIALDKIDTANQAQDKIRQVEAQVSSEENNVSKADKKILKSDSKIKEAEKEVADAQKEVDRLKALKENVSSSAEQTIYDQAKTDLEAIQADITLTEKEKKRKEDLIEKYENGEAKESYWITFEQYQEASNSYKDTVKKLIELQEQEASYQERLNTTKTALENANRQKAATIIVKLETAQDMVDNATEGKSDAELAKKEAELAKQDAQKALDERKARLEEVKGKAPSLEEAKKAVEDSRRNIEKMITELKKTQGTDSNAKDLNNLDLSNLRNKITKLEVKIQKIKNDSKEMEVKSKVAGIVSSVNYVAGDTTDVEKALAVVELTDRGYSAKIVVTNEQSKRVKEGIKAEIINVWGSDVTATLTQIKNDPDNPGKNKVLTFTVKGDVSMGQTLELSLGDKSAFYDVIVPNSAIREDSKGKFILTVQAKNSPLGNRYIATRMDVEVLAQDETSSAISGAGMGSEFVITTSTKPIQPGKQVKLVEGGDS